MRYKISACGLKIQIVIFSLAVNLPEKNIPCLLLKRFSVKTMLVMTSKMHTEILSYRARQRRFTDTNKEL